MGNSIYPWMTFPQFPNTWIWQEELIHETSLIITLSCSNNNKLEDKPLKRIMRKNFKGQTRHPGSRCRGQNVCHVSRKVWILATVWLALYTNKTPRNVFQTCIYSCEMEISPCNCPLLISSIWTWDTGDMFLTNPAFWPILLTCASRLSSADPCWPS